jgi:hypothetical protein
MSGTLKAKPGKVPQTAPSDTSQVLSVFTSNHVQQLLDILKQATGEISSSSPEAGPSEKKKDGTKPIRASKPKIASVYQLYD